MGRPVDNENALSDGDAHDVIVDLKRGNELTEETLRRFAEWARDRDEKLGWLLDEAVCKRCHGPISKVSAMCLQDCSVKGAA
jgi:hypothetical protein